MHSSIHVFQSEKFWKYLSYEAHAFLKKHSKFYVDSKNAVKYPQNIFEF